MIKQDKSIISNIAGTTRDFISGEVILDKRKFELIDFGGIDFTPTGKIEEETNRLVLNNINNLDLILFLVDGRCSINEKDKRIVDILRKERKNIILVVNKIDGLKQEDNVYDFYSLGIDNLIAISAANNRNINILLDMIVNELKIKKEKEIEAEEVVKISIIGRPNVGKSTLFNLICGGERSIVTEIAGTTRDAIDSEVIIDKKKYLFIDTAGLKRRAKISYVLDKFSANKSLNAINRADMVLYVIDYTVGIVGYDINLIDHAWKRGKSIIIVINKWDMRDDGLNGKKYQELLINDNNIFKKFPFVFISALRGKEMPSLIKEIEKIVDSSTARISTPILNREIRIINSKFIGSGGAKIFYATQIGVRPIKILLFVNSQRLFKGKHLDFMEKNLRTRFNLSGVPIVFKMRDKSDGSRRDVMN